MPSPPTTPHIALLLAAALFSSLTGCDLLKQREAATTQAGMTAPAKLAGEGEETAETIPAAAALGGDTAPESQPESQPARELTPRESREQQTLKKLGKLEGKAKIPLYIDAFLPFITRHELGEEEGEVTVWFEGDSEPFSFTIDYEMNRERAIPISIEKPL